MLKSVLNFATQNDWLGEDGQPRGQFALFPAKERLTSQDQIKFFPDQTQMDDFLKTAPDVSLYDKMAWNNGDFKQID